MSQGSDPNESVVVERDGVRVEKRFTADEFPVPAVEFTLRSGRDDATEFRVVDDIPEDFPMERVGFHPDYESEHWTAYQDHRVAYRRRLEPGEEVTTVYGIRTDDPDAGGAFLGEPTVGEVTEDTDPVGDVATVIGEDASQVVRDVLSGERDSVPGSEPPSAESGADATGDDVGDVVGAKAELDLEDPPTADSPGDGAERGDEVGEPAGASQSDDVTGPDDEAVSAAVGDEPGEPASGDASPDPLGEADEPEPDLDIGTADLEEVVGGEPDPDDELDLQLDDPQGEVAADEAVDSTDDADVPVDDAAAPAEAAREETDAGPAAGAGGAESVAAVLAAELRAGEVSEEDRETLTRELELQHSDSVDARIARLQSTVEDLGAYTDALEAFIDDNGTADEIVGELREDVSDVRDAVEALEDDFADAADERSDLADDVSAVRDEVDAVEDDLASTAEDLEAGLAEVRTEVGDLADDLESEDEAVADVRDAVADLRDEVSSLSETVDDDVGDVNAELAQIRNEIEELHQFRDRLSSVFGTGGAPGDPGDAEE